VYLTPEVQLASSIAHITILLNVSWWHGTMPYSQELTFSNYSSKGKFTILSFCGTPPLGCPLPDTSSQDSGNHGGQATQYNTHKVCQQQFNNN